MSLVFFITDRATFTVELCFTVKRIHSDIDLFSMIVRNGIYCIYGLNVDPLWGPSRAFFLGRGIRHFFGRDIVGKVGFRIAGNAMRYTHCTSNFVNLLFGKREKYEMMA